jgi:hypothetical protein
LKRRESQSKDRDLLHSLPALRRAARAALELGIRTRTPVWVIQDGKMIDLTKSKKAPRISRKG